VWSRVKWEKEESAREKMKKEHQHEGTSLPIPIAPNDLNAIGDILAGYIAYVQNNGHGSAQTRNKLQELQGIHSRIIFLRQGGDGTAAAVTTNDLRAIREAMLIFVRVIRHTVPQSSERDETLRRVTLLRKSLEKHLL
jgi:hypothetical protein